MVCACGFVRVCIHAPAKLIHIQSTFMDGTTDPRVYYGCIESRIALKRNQMANCRRRCQETKPLTGWRSWLDYHPKVERYHLNIEKFTAFIVL